MENEEQEDTAATWGKFAVIEIYSKATGVIVSLSCVKTVTWNKTKAVCTCCTATQRQGDERN